MVDSIGVMSEWLVKEEDVCSGGKMVSTWFIYRCTWLRTVCSRSKTSAEAEKVPWAP